MGEAAIEMLIGETERVSADVQERRHQARTLAIQTIRHLEQRVQQAIGSDVLRGMAVLVPNGVRTVYRGANIRSSSRAGIDTGLPRERWTLVLSERGALELAYWDPTDVRTLPVDDSELMAQDLAPIVRAVQLVLERHVARSTRTAESYRRLEELARKLATSIGFTFES